MGEIRNCRRCGKLFGYTGKMVCPACVKKEDEDFEVVRTYVKENPGCGMKQVSEETGVEMKLLMKFLREKRIEFADGTAAILTCESCGVPVSSGRYCNACLSKLGKEMMQHSSMQKKTPASPSSNSGMHYNKNIKQ